MSNSFVTLWTVSRQAPLSMSFSRQEYWSGLPYPPPGDLPNPGFKCTSLISPALAGWFFTTSATGKPTYDYLLFFCCSVTKLCLTSCNPMDCSTASFPVLHCLLEFAQTHVHWVDDAIQPSRALLPSFFSCLHSFPTSGSFPMSPFFESGGQRVGASTSASVLPMNIQGLFPLGLTGLISL